MRRGDVLAVRARAHAAVELQRAKGISLAVPNWLEVSSEGFQARLAMLPDADAVPFPIEIGHVVEFYS